MERGKELKRCDARPNNRTWDSRGQTGAVICTRKSGQGQKSEQEIFPFLFNLIIRYVHSLHRVGKV